MIKSSDSELEDFKLMHPGSETWTRTISNNYEDLRFNRNGYVAQYNSLVGEYNSRMRDLTTNQRWMKPDNFPEKLDLYVTGKSLTSADPELVYK